MVNDGQPDNELDPAGDLLRVAGRVVPDWLTGLALDRARRAGRIDELQTGEGRAALDELVDDVADRLLARLDALVNTDVDAQRTNPLSLFRAATGPLNELLRRYAIEPPPRDRFAVERFPDDHYNLTPAGWDDIHPDLQAVGLAWGAWKAMTVLRRRRDEGLR